MRFRSITNEEIIKNAKAAIERNYITAQNKIDEVFNIKSYERCYIDVNDEECKGDKYYNNLYAYGDTHYIVLRDKMFIYAEPEIGDKIVYSWTDQGEDTITTPNGTVLYSEEAVNQMIDDAFGKLVKGVDISVYYYGEEYSDWKKIIIPILERRCGWFKEDCDGERLLARLTPKDYQIIVNDVIEAVKEPIYRFFQKYREEVPECDKWLYERETLMAALNPVMNDEEKRFADFAKCYDTIEREIEKQFSAPKKVGRPRKKEQSK